MLHEWLFGSAARLLMGENVELDDESALFKVLAVAGIDKTVLVLPDDEGKGGVGGSWSGADRRLKRVLDLL